MGETKPTVLVTGISGNLGLRLLPQLADFNVVGVDLNPPQTNLPLSFERMDLGQTEANRDVAVVEKFIFPSSVSAYGSDLTRLVTEDFPLGGHTLPYAIHKMESDRVVQQRAPSLRGCSVYMLRPHIFAGASVQNYLVGSFRGTPNGRSNRAQRMREKGKRLPCMLPYGRKYLENRIQFVHVDDMARLIAFILRKTEPEAKRLTILNVAGRGEPLTFEQCIGMAQAKLFRVPTKSLFRRVLKVLWKAGISAIPP